jgi:hypothetical protein
VTAARRVPPIVARALRPGHPHCYRHCEDPVTARKVRTELPGTLEVYACPGGVVSVTVYTEWSDRDPTRLVARELRRRSVPTTLVRSHDLRTASRHGPELGRAAERLLARARPPRPVRSVYWRLYPFRRGTQELRLFACFRHGPGTAVWFVAPTPVGTAACPECRPRAPRRR